MPSRRRRPSVGPVTIRHQAGHFVRDFSRVSEIQLCAAVLFQGTVGPCARGLDLIAGGVLSMRKPPASVAPCELGRLRVARGFIGAQLVHSNRPCDGDPQRILTTRNTREALKRAGGKSCPSAKKLNASGGSASMHICFVRAVENGGMERYAVLLLSFFSCSPR